jgi:hypothetical protein
MTPEEIVKNMDFPSEKGCSLLPSNTESGIPCPVLECVCPVSCFNQDERRCHMGGDNTHPIRQPPKIEDDKENG